MKNWLRIESPNGCLELKVLKAWAPRSGEPVGRGLESRQGRRWYDFLRGNIVKSIDNERL